MIKTTIKNSNTFRFLATLFFQIKDNYRILQFSIKLLFKNHNTDLVFFFPFYHTGGAEKVHLDIVTTMKNKKPLVFFTGKSYNEHFKLEFFEKANCYEIFSCIRKQQLGRRFFLYALKFKLNTIKNLKVFSSNDSFFYEIVPFLNINTKVIDLIHAFTFKNEPGAEKWSLPIASRFNKRIVINEKTRMDLIEQYKENLIDISLVDRILMISNKVKLSDCFSKKQNTGKLKLLYVGRNGEEKRIYLIAKIAEKCHLKKINSDFIFIGESLSSVVADSLKTHCFFVGNIDKEEDLISYYENSDILLITSSREGFPLTIMEAMANAVVPISTNVGGISYHIKHRENGFLINSAFNEQELIDEAVQFIEILYYNRDLLFKMSKTAHLYAKNNFSEAVFKQKYKELLD